MSLGVELPPPDPADVAALVETARELEAAGVDHVVLPDPGPGGLPAVLLGARVAAATSTLGIVVGARAGGAEPLHLSTALATLDHVSHGRAGWLVQTRDGELDAPNEARDVEAVVDAVVRLWDSWDDDAVVREVATGRYLDRDRLHRVDVRGPGWAVVGPSTTPRPPQGHLVVLALGDGARLAGSARAAHHLDLVEDRSPGSAARVAARVVVVRGADGVRLDEAVGLADDRHVLLVGADPRRVAEAVARTGPAEPTVSPRRPPAPGTTLRERLGLARPSSRLGDAA